MVKYLQLMWTDGGIRILRWLHYVLLSLGSFFNPFAPYLVCTAIYVWEHFTWNSESLPDIWRRRPNPVYLIWLWSKLEVCWSQWLCHKCCNQWCWGDLLLTPRRSDHILHSHCVGLTSSNDIRQLGEDKCVLIASYFVVGRIGYCWRFYGQFVLVGFVGYDWWVPGCLGTWSLIPGWTVGCPGMTFFSLWDLGS